MNSFTVIEFIARQYNMACMLVDIVKSKILQVFEKKILYAKEITKDGFISHNIPLLRIKLVNNWKVCFVNDFDVAHLSHVYFVLNRKIESMICKSKSVHEQRRRVYCLTRNALDQSRKNAINYLMVECGNKDLSRVYNNTSWSFKYSEVTVGDFKQILRLPSSEILEVTGDDFCILEKSDDEIFF
jgi:hypothetical protein